MSDSPKRVKLVAPPLPPIMAATMSIVATAEVNERDQDWLLHAAVELRSGTPLAPRLLPRLGYQRYQEERVIAERWQARELEPRRARPRSSSPHP